MKKKLFHLNVKTFISCIFALTLGLFSVSCSDDDNPGSVGGDGEGGGASTGTSPVSLAECVAGDVQAFQTLAKANAASGLFAGQNPSEWKNVSLTWVKDAEGKFAVSEIDIEKEAQIKDLVVRLDGSKGQVFSQLRKLSVASPSVKEFAVADQPLLAEVNIDGMGASPVDTLNLQGGKTLVDIEIQHLPNVSYIFLGGDSILTLGLEDLPALEEQANLRFRTVYDEGNGKDTQIEKITLKGDLSKLNGLNLNSMNLKQFDLQTTLPELTNLALNGNHLSGTLTLKGMNKLNTLYLMNNDYTSINVSECAALTEVEVSRNKDLSSLELDVPSLTVLGADETSLASLDITHLTSLKRITANDSKLTSVLMGEMNSKLERINLSNNQLTAFVLPATVVEPYQLYLGGNKLTSLDVKVAGSLEDLYLSKNELQTVVLPEEKEMLTILECGGNHFSAKFLRSIEEEYTALEEVDAAPQFVLGRVNGRQVDAKEETVLGMEPYVVKLNGEVWEEANIEAADGMFNLPADGTYRVICISVFNNWRFDETFSQDVPYVIGEVK